MTVVLAVGILCVVYFMYSGQVHSPSEDDSSVSVHQASFTTSCLADPHLSIFCYVLWHLLWTQLYLIDTISKENLHTYDTFGTWSYIVNHLQFTAILLTELLGHDSQTSFIRASHFYNSRFIATMMRFNRVYLTF